MSEHGSQVRSVLFGRWLDAQTVPVNGFEWNSGEEFEFDDESRLDGYTPTSWGPWLVPADGAEAEERPVDLLTDPDRANFLRVFTGLADGSEARRRDRVLQFANRYGYLDRDKLDRLFSKPGRPDAFFGKAEAWRSWELAIFRAATIVALWDRVRWQQSTALAPLVRWWEPPHATVGAIYRDRSLHPYPFPDGYAVIPDFDAWRDGAGIVDQDVRLDECAASSAAALDWPGNPIEAVRQAVYEQIMQRLDGKVTPYLSRELGDDLWYLPRTLHAAVYLHLAREISGRSRQLVQCANRQCGRSFEPKHGAQLYCGRSCRNQAHYHRHMDR